MVLRIGTDCSGIEAPIQALQQLNIPFEHKWACEIDKFTRQSIEANYKPEKMYTDITKRIHALLPDIDMYICGFPCTPISLMGLQKGTEDTRSNIMFHCIKVIQKKSPKFFILENVKNFKVIQNSEPFNYLINQLEKAKHDGDVAYNVYHHVLNTKDYGIPQNRERLFIVGIRKDIQVAEYSIPENVHMKDLEDVLVDKAICDVEPNKNAMRVINKFNLTSAFNKVVSCAGFGNYMRNMSPTLTCNTVYYLTKYKRYLTPRECLLLQGFSPEFQQAVSNKQLHRQAGNSMSVCVLIAILERIFSVTEIDVN